MNNITSIAQLTGTISIFLLCCIILYIIANTASWAKSGRVAALWLIIYIFFLFILRAINLLGIADQNSLRIISGFSGLIPLLGVCIHMFLFKQSTPAGDITASIEEAKQLIEEARQIKTEATNMLISARKETKQ